jgi:glycosyltransferase involved in cell wall biosynthesis
MKKKILILAGYYLPSMKGGGPIQSINNIVENLFNDFDFFIIAADRDFGDVSPFKNICADSWVKVGEANVFYTNITELNWKKTSEIINSSGCKILYLNSFFDYKFSIVPVILERIKKIQVDKIILAPRGQFSPGALGLKGIKKKLFIRIAKILCFYKNITWHATAESEKKYIQLLFGENIDLKIISNLTANYASLINDKALIKNRDKLKVVFVSRIHPKKNLKQAIQFFENLNGCVEFNIYGPIEDKRYWEECKKGISDLPKNINITYQGTVEHDKIIDIFKNHHIFLFPTLGENFGHVISESLIGGCPVIISDQTPWRNLKEDNVGWDLPLQKKDKFVEVLKYCIHMDNDEYQVLSENSFQYGKKKSNNKELSKKYFKIFNN